jgi:hypothetical protein
MSSPSARRSLRSTGDAVREAAPDAIAAIVCAIAWIRPDAPGFDLLSTAGLLYCIELPLAIITMFAIVRRIRDGRWSRLQKAGYVLVPTLILAALGAALLGSAALVAIAWLGGRTLLQLWRDVPGVDGDFSGMWLKSTRVGNKITSEWVSHRPASLPRGVTMIPAGHEHIMAFTTIVAWFAILILIAVLPALGEGGATAAYAASVGWTATPIGEQLPAHLALAAGVLLFGIRTLLHFEGTGAAEAPAPAPAIEDDQILRDVIEAVEGKPPTSRKPRKSRKR